MRSINLDKALKGRDDIAEGLIKIIHDEVCRHADMLSTKPRHLIIDSNDLKGKIITEEFVKLLTSMGSACMVRLALSENINIEALKSVLIKYIDEQKH